MTESTAALQLLRWYVAMGADEALGWSPRGGPRQGDAPSPPPAVMAAAAPQPVPAAPLPIAAAAPPSPAAASSLADLAERIRAFDGCALKRTATNTVIADGVPGAPLMIVGEAPGADEDRIGRPFVGRSGQLLDRMLATIGFSRATNTYITNILFWRPPGNRKPTSEEIAVCLPFVWQHIALARPRFLLLSGGTAAAALLGRGDGIMRLRGRWFDLAVPGLEAPVPALATYHPSFLLRSPARKGEAWRDLLSLEARFAAQSPAAAAQ